MRKQPGTVVSPDALYFRYEDEIEGRFIQIPNWKREVPFGRYVFAAKFEDPESGLVKIMGYPKIEAWDSLEDAELGNSPTSEFLAGTDHTGKMPLLRSIDMTQEVIGYDPKPGHPPPEWWNIASYGANTDRIKSLRGTDSYLQCGTIIKTPDGEVYPDDSGISYSGNTYSSVFYFSIAPIIPPDSYRGMTGHTVAVSVRVNTA